MQNRKPRLPSTSQAWRRLVAVVALALGSTLISTPPAHAADPVLSLVWADDRDLAITMGVTGAPGPYVMFRLFNPVSFYLGDKGFVDSPPIPVIDGAASATVSMLGLARIPTASAVTCTGPTADDTCDLASIVTPRRFFRSDPWAISIDWQPEMFFNPDLADWSFTLHDSVHAPSVKVVIRNSDYSGPVREIPITDETTETVDLSDLPDGQYRVGIMRCSLVNPAICTAYATPFNQLIIRRQMRLDGGMSVLATPNGDGFADAFHTWWFPDYAIPSPAVSWRILAPDKTTALTRWQAGSWGAKAEYGYLLMSNPSAARPAGFREGRYWLEVRTRGSRNGFSYQATQITNLEVPPGQRLDTLSTMAPSFNPERHPNIAMYLSKRIELGTVTAATLKAINSHGVVVWQRGKAGGTVYDSWYRPGWPGRDTSGRICPQGRYRLKLTLTDIDGVSKSFTTPAFRLLRN